MKKTKTVKAWALFDTETGTIGVYPWAGREYMVGCDKFKRKDLHETLIPVPCTITYELPNLIKQPKI